jgi:hypothetical protein
MITTCNTSRKRLQPGDTVFAEVRCIVVHGDVDGYGVARVRPAYPFYDVDWQQDVQGDVSWVSVDEMTEDFS